MRNLHDTEILSVVGGYRFEEKEEEEEKKKPEEEEQQRLNEIVVTVGRILTTSPHRAVKLIGYTITGFGLLADLDSLSETFTPDDDNDGDGDCTITLTESDSETSLTMTEGCKDFSDDVIMGGQGVVYH